MANTKKLLNNADIVRRNLPHHGYTLCSLSPLTESKRKLSAMFDWLISIITP